MFATSYRSVLLSLVVLAGCDRPATPVDGGRDAGGETADASMVDASMREDASMLEDASAPDAAMSDGSISDGSISDGSMEPDATTNTCGDGVMGGDEECDDGTDNSDTLANACRTDCTLAGCGDGVSDTGETCDGADIGGHTCGDEGFVGGVLGCASTCDGYDTALCSTCGDATVNGADQCDGADLDGRTCVDELGAGALGELACASDCTFDVSDCTLCGNGVIDAGETCDTDALGGATCPEGGTISCSATCALDMSACTSCGDGTAQGAEACDGADLRGESCASRPGFMSGVLRCDASCALDETMCSAAAPVTTVGQIVISEIMQNPAAFGDDDGEWFEVHNPGAAPLELGGCLVTGAGGTGDRFPVDESVIVPAGGYATFATSSTVAGAPGFTPDYVWTTGFNLGNSGDTVAITCGGTMIDTVVYDETAFPDPNGASMNLSSTALTASANDAGGSWCESTTPFGGGAPPDRGTPGAANEECLSYTVTSCRLETPPAITGDIGTSHPVDGRVHVAGLTTLTTGNDPSTFIVGAVGFGPDGSDPATATGWTWITASPRAGWVDTAEVGSDEYRATLVAPGPAGSFDYAYRFSADSGATWTYCDTGAAGSTDGYQIANAGALTTTGTGPAALYFSEYIEGSSSNKALEIHNPGTASADLSMCEIRLYSNGASSASATLALTGSLAAGDVFVACHASIATAIRPQCDVLVTGGGAINFNGDDAVELHCAGTTLDVIGVIGTDPGSAWSVGGLSTLDRTLRRQCTVMSGDPNGADAFDPSVEWTGFPQDTFDGLGAHCPPPTP
jgi:hypothetical protein